MAYILPPNPTRNNNLFNDVPVPDVTPKQNVEIKVEDKLSHTELMEAF